MSEANIVDYDVLVVDADVVVAVGVVVAEVED